MTFARSAVWWPRVVRSWSLIFVVLVASCGGDNHVATDAGIPDAMVDGAATYPACHEFSTLGITVPVHHAGMLDGADVLSPSACAEIDARVQQVATDFLGQALATIGQTPTPGADKLSR